MENRIISIFILTISLVSVIAFSGLFGEEVTNQIQYLLFEKAFDGDNGSTAARSVPFYINLGAFSEFPFLGVGNGLQGYFAEKYFPMELLSVEGSDIVDFFEVSKTGIANAGVFILGLLSGYGIVGCFFIFLVVKKMVCLANTKKKSLGSFHLMYIVGSVVFFVMGFQGDAYGMYFAWFVLSLPFIPEVRDDSSGSCS